ncbi:MAG: acyl-CoA dehydrogenase family protein [Porticoccaceae bacterium]|nr:acyl-CoA dehydrogenase family protein [Porticoccaceae bacterium]
MSYQTTPGIYGTEHEIFRETFRRFLVEEVEPHIEEWTENHGIPKEFWKKAGAAGILGVDVPEEYGGPGGDFLFRLVIAEELGYSPASATVGPAIIGDVVGDLLHRCGSKEQCQRWLPGMVKGEYRGAFALTEPDSGSDVSSIRATAVRDGDEYIINGSKTYISNSADADFFIVGCKTESGNGAKSVSVIIVESDTPGCRCGRNLKKMGCNASMTGEVFFEDVRVPVSNILGKEGDGMRIMLGGVNMDRLIFPVLGHAAGTRVFEETVEFVKNRKAFGQTIFDFQNTQFKLADIKTELAVGRAFIDTVIRNYKENGKLDSQLCAMAKLWVCEMEGRVIDQCLQLHGGAGYMDEYNVSRFYTAARLHRIFAGTSEIMRLLIARTI